MGKRITFFGRVQGIGFRAAAEMLAVKYGIGGWVQNNDDGTVRLVIEGEKEKMNNFIDHLKRYFKNNIDKIEEREESEHGFQEFIIR
jgi:acylphosphatase